MSTLEERLDLLEVKMRRLQTERAPRYLGAPFVADETPSSKDLIQWDDSVKKWRPGGLTITSEAQGDILYHNGTDWVRLGAGTSGYYLKTQGAGANPAWATVNGAMKTSGSGYFTIPVMPSLGTVVAKSGSADTWGSWVEMIASTAAAIYIVAVKAYVVGSNTYIALDIGTGANPNEASIGYLAMPGEDAGADDGMKGATIPLPHAIPVATSTRIACRSAGSSASADSITVTLICINQADLVAL